MSQKTFKKKQNGLETAGYCSEENSRNCRKQGASQLIYNQGCGHYELCRNQILLQERLTMYCDVHSAVY